MNHYYLNKSPQANGDHEVHKENCKFLPLEHNRIYLGTFSTCSEAVQEAKKTYLLSDGCKFCIPECHTR
jgi:hypothetical protein